MSERKQEDPEVIVDRQHEVRGALYRDQGIAGLQMTNSDGIAIAEIWIGANSIRDVIEWLEFARYQLLGREHDSGGY